MIKKPTDAEILIVLTTHPESFSVICETKTMINLNHVTLYLDEGCKVHSKTSMFVAGRTIMKDVNLQYFAPMKNLVNQTHMTFLTLQKPLTIEVTHTPLEPINIRKITPKNREDNKFIFFVKNSYYLSFAKIR